jgi:hypothetical protein
MTRFDDPGAASAHNAEMRLRGRCQRRLGKQIARLSRERLWPRGIRRIEGHLLLPGAYIYIYEQQSDLHFRLL